MPIDRPKQTRYNWGYVDGRNSSKMKNPIHSNFPRNKSDKIIHFDSVYLKGYIRGWRDHSSILPWCFK